MAVIKLVTIEQKRNGKGQWRKGHDYSFPTPTKLLAIFLGIWGAIGLVGTLQLLGAI